MRILLIQVVLVVGILIISARLLRGRGARVVALRRIGMLAFAALAIASILFPETWTRVAKLVGVGRGTDMVPVSYTHLDVYKRQVGRLRLHVPPRPGAPAGRCLLYTSRCV